VQISTDAGGIRESGLNLSSLASATQATIIPPPKHDVQLHADINGSTLAWSTSKRLAGKK